MIVVCENMLIGVVVVVVVLCSPQIDGCAIAIAPFTWPTLTNKLKCNFIKAYTHTLIPHRASVQGMCTRNVQTVEQALRTHTQSGE